MISLSLFFTSFFLYFITLAPSITTVDTPEFVSAAYTLGIPHSPGYSLYMLIGHFVTHLPIGDNPAFRMNLLSAVALACTVVLLYHSLLRFVENRWVAVASSLIFASSYYVWTIGIIAEVYALQLMTLAICIRLAVALWNNPMPRYALSLGCAFGIAVAMYPASALFAPGMLAVYVSLKIPWRIRILSGGLAILIFFASLLYFPIRYHANPQVNTVGEFNSQGEFEAVDLSTIDGIIWLLSGRQFQEMFFEQGINVAEPINWFLGNFLGIGVVMGVLGLAFWWGKHRSLLWIWLITCSVYTVFYAVYGADDRQTMFGAVYLLWMIPLAVGFEDVILPLKWRNQIVALISLPLIFILVNFSHVNLREDNRIPDYAEVLMNELPRDAVVFGNWRDVMPLYYFQVVENRRLDLELYNLFLFGHDAERIKSVTDNLITQGKVVVFLNNSVPSGYSTDVLFFQVDPFTKEMAIHQIIR